MTENAGKNLPTCEPPSSTGWEAVCVNDCSAPIREGLLADKVASGYAGPERASRLNGKETGRAGSLLGIALGQNALAILDQGVVSATRFLTVVIVGRSCGPHELGDYTLGFTLYCIAACVHTSLIALPFTIYDHHVQGDERRVYAGSVLAHFALFDLLVLAVLGLAAGVLAAGWAWPRLAPFTGVLAITIPLALVVEFARRFALARLELTTALAIDVAMSAIQVAGLLLLVVSGRLSAATAFAATGLAGAVAGVTWLWFGRHHFVIQPRRVLADGLRNWRFGRWSLGSQLMLAARSAAVLWLLALLLDPTSIGIYGACDNLVRLSAPLMMAVASVLCARAAGAAARRDMAAVRRLARHAAAMLVGATAVLCGLFVCFGDRALAKLYGAAYGAQGTVLTLLAIAAVADGLETAASNALMALDRSDLNFAANLFGTVLTLVIAVLMVPGWGIVGAAWGSLLGRWAISAVVWVTFLRLSRHEAGGVA